MSAPDELFLIRPVVAPGEGVRGVFHVTDTDPRDGSERYVRAPTAPQGAEPVACPDHHYRAGGYCPHCQSHLHPAVCDLSQREYDDLMRDAMKWRARAIADAAPQGAEIARMQDGPLEEAEELAQLLEDRDLEIAEFHAMQLRIAHYLHLYCDNRRAALTPTDAETKNGSQV
jgi:hypothetical protein